MRVAYNIFKTWAVAGCAKSGPTAQPLNSRMTANAVALADNTLAATWDIGYLNKKRGDPSIISDLPEAGCVQRATKAKVVCSHGGRERLWLARPNLTHSGSRSDDQKRGEANLRVIAFAMW